MKPAHGEADNHTQRISVTRASPVKTMATPYCYHRATMEYGRPNHSGISRRNLGAPKFSRDFVAVPRNSPAPSPVAL
jgi:hypothetical protein